MDNLHRIFAAAPVPQVSRTNRPDAISARTPAPAFRPIRDRREAAHAYRQIADAPAIEAHDAEVEAVARRPFRKNKLDEIASPRLSGSLALARGWRGAATGNQADRLDVDRRNPVMVHVQLAPNTDASVAVPDRTFDSAKRLDQQPNRNRRKQSLNS